MPIAPEPPSYLAEPTIQYLFQVLEQIQAGEIQFPRFQRFSVWKPEQRRELLRSIREGIPIGTLLLWRTRRDDVNIERHVGVHELPAARAGEGTRQYVLDGVQRLSTLYGSLFEPNLRERGDDGETLDDFLVYFDLREQDFYFKSDLEDGKPLARHLPLTVLRDSVRLLKFQRLLKGPEAEKYTERADALARAFREYKVPVVPLASDDLSHATKTFQRINTQGTPMSEVHMVNALVFSTDFDLLERIREGRQELLAPVGWQALEDEAVLRTIKALLGIDVYATQPDETRLALKKRLAVVDEALNALARTAVFLDTALGVRSPGLVPYGAQTVLLAATLHEEPTPSKAGKEALTDWVKLTTYTEVFASNMSASRFAALAKELRRAARGESLVWSVRRPLTRRDLPPSFDFRHARARFLALRMARERGKLASALEFDPLRALAQEGVAAVPQLITHRMAQAGGQWLQSPGARIVTAERSLAAVRQVVLSRSASDAELRSYLISGPVHRLLVAERFEAAVTARERELNEHEAADFRVLLERHSSLQASSVSSPSQVTSAARMDKQSIPRRGRGVSRRRG